MMSIAIFLLKGSCLPAFMHSRMASMYLVLGVSRKRLLLACDLDGWWVLKRLSNTVSIVGRRKWEVVQTTSWHLWLRSTAEVDTWRSIFCNCAHFITCAVMLR